MDSGLNLCCYLKWARKFKLEIGNCSFLSFFFYNLFWGMLHIFFYFLYLNEILVIGWRCVGWREFIDFIEFGDILLIVGFNFLSGGNLISCTVVGILIVGIDSLTNIITASALILVIPLSSYIRRGRGPLAIWCICVKTIW